MKQINTISIRDRNFFNGKSDSFNCHLLAHSEQLKHLKNVGNLFKAYYKTTRTRSMTLIALRKFMSVNTNQRHEGLI